MTARARLRWALITCVCATKLQAGQIVLASSTRAMEFPEKTGIEMRKF
jgi:hypothetical protein